MYVCEDTEEDIHTEAFTQRQTHRDIHRERDIPPTYIIQTQTNITIYKYLLYQQQQKKAIITYKKTHT